MSPLEELRRTGQERLAAAIGSLPPAAAARLAAQVEEVDLDLIARLVDRLVRVEGPSLDSDVSPAEPGDLVPLAEGADAHAREREAREAGEACLREGRTAAVLLAGGQGSRLGFEGPKGAFPFMPITGRPLFWQHASTIAAVRERYSAPIPLYILTSPTNDEQTRAVFAENSHFGLDPASVRFVVQGTLPAVDARTGDILREAPDRLALSPDGHGGLLSALQQSGSLAEMAEMGIDCLFTYQVDNPLVRACRPEFIGHHVLSDSQMSSVVVRKLSAGERMGVIARVNGRPGVIEYSDLPDELAERRDERGELVYWAGSIAVHCIDRGFAEALSAGGLRLPYHRALKRVPHVDDAGRPVDPDGANAVKFETFLFDALASAERTVAVEAPREEEFAPVKNSIGADSPATARAALVRRNADWIEAAGGRVARDGDGEPVDTEIDPMLALDADQLRASLPPEALVIEGPTVLEPTAVSR